MEITSDFVTYLMIVAIIYLLGNLLLSIIQFRNSLIGLYLGGLDLISGFIGVFVWDKYMSDMFSGLLHWSGYIGFYLTVLFGCYHILRYLLGTDRRE